MCEYQKYKGDTKMDENAESLVVVHTHTHTGNLLEKINRRNI